MIEPYQGRVYDPCCGSGGMFVESERFDLARWKRVNRAQHRARKVTHRSSQGHPIAGRMPIDDRLAPNTRRLAVALHQRR